MGYTKEDERFNIYVTENRDMAQNYTTFSDS